MGLRLPGRVQIAGVIDQAEADLIIASGADLLGFPLGLEDGREDLGVDGAAAIVRRSSGRVTAVCITYLKIADEIAGLCRRLGTRWVQLHGPIEVSEIRKLRALDGSLGVIKSLIVRPGGEGRIMRQLQEFEPLVDAFITDSFDVETGRSGATGKTHDWAVSRKIVSGTAKPVILAGGLTAENVAEGIAFVRPAAVDAHTGVEGPDGRKDAGRVRAFSQAALAALDLGAAH